MNTGLFLATLALASGFGFLTRWANICIVHAGERWLVHRRADVLLDFASCAAFSGLLLVPLAWTMPGWMQLSPVAWPTLPLFAGALLFGLGASVNGACAFGTVARIGAGDFALLFSLPGYALGLVLGRGLGATRPTPWNSPVAHFDTVGLGWWLLLALLASLEVRAMRTAPPGRRRRDRLMLIAMSLCGGLLFAMVRNSIYGRAVEPGVRWLARIPGMYEWSGLTLLLAVLGGATVAGVIRSEWRWRPPQPLRSLQSLAGGTLMGCGAALIPGGNDFLVLWGAPSAAPDAMVALPAMVTGVLAGLWLGGSRRQPVAPA